VGDGSSLLRSKSTGEKALLRALVEQFGVGWQTDVFLDLIERRNLLDGYRKYMEEALDSGIPGGWMPVKYGEWLDLPDRDRPLEGE
tara:strand:+ start:701 stop:958 length:258 start_codon:yes stop_codon:yes gene_type:complete